MRKIDFGQSVTLLANIGVIAGIVFLAMELRQNTAAIQGATYQALADGQSNQQLGVAHDPELTSALRAAYGFEDLLEVEEFRVIFFYNALVQRLENTYFQWRTGLVDDRVFQSYGWTDRILNTEHFAVYWNLIGANFNTDPQFRRFFEENVDLWTCPAGLDALPDNSPFAERVKSFCQEQASVP